MSSDRNDFTGSIILPVLIGIVLLGMIGFILFKSLHKPSVSSPSLQTTTQPNDAVPVKDFAPNLPVNQKSTITIRTSDSSEVKYLVPAGQVDTYVKSLPPGSAVVSISK